MSTTLITYEGADALAKAVSNNIDAAINAMYFAVRTTGGGTPPAVDRTYSADDFRALTSPDDLFRVLLNPGTLTPSSAEYTGNMVNFTGVLPAGSTGILHGLQATGGVAEITHAGLVIAPDLEDYTADLLYAVYAPDTAVLIPANGAEALRWQIAFA